MNDINLIDSCKAHLLCNTLRTSNSFARSGTDIVIDSEAHLSRTCKTSILFAPLAVGVHTVCSAFSVLHANKAVNTIIYEIQN